MPAPDQSPTRSSRDARKREKRPRPDRLADFPYRRLVRSVALVGFRVRVEQTDLFIRAARDLTGLAHELVQEARERIVHYARGRPEFLTSLCPLSTPGPAPSPVNEMLRASELGGVGPMAAVAGAIAEFVGRGLLPASPAGVIVENGGDIFIGPGAAVTVGLHAGASPLSMRLGLRLLPENLPAGICTSSATIGHSLSLGRVDAATILADNAALADAVATTLGNRVSSPDHIQAALELVLAIPGVRGAVVILGDHLGLLGELEVVPLDNG